MTLDIDQKRQLRRLQALQIQHMTFKITVLIQHTCQVLDSRLALTVRTQLKTKVYRILILEGEMESNNAWMVESLE